MLYISDLDTLNRIRFKIYYYFVLRASCFGFNVAEHSFAQFGFSLYSPITHHSSPIIHHHFHYSK